MARYSLIFKISILLLLVFVLPACTSCTLTPIEVGCYINELIDAINTANSSPNPDVINLAADCLYTFHEIDNNADVYGTYHEDGGNALPVISTHITINGNGARLIRAGDSGTPEFRFFKIITDGDLNLNDLSMENGAVQSAVYNAGGAIWNDGGVLKVNNVSFSQNSAKDAGGAIRNVEGEVTINDSVLTENSSRWGGAIHNSGTLTISGSSTFSNNSADQGGGALYNYKILTIQGFSDIQTLYGITFESNSAGMDGGAIFSNSVNDDAQLSIRRAIFRDNTSDSFGGAIYAWDEHQLLDVFGSSFTGNYSGLQGGAVVIREMGTIGSNIEESNFDGNASGEDAGAIYIGPNTPIIINNSVFNNNSAAINAGAILNYSEMSVNSSQFTSNTAGSMGGGILTGRSNSVVFLDDVLLQNNSAGLNGGGVYVAIGSVNIANSTIQGNQAAKDGGGLYIDTGIVTISADTRFEDNGAQNNGGGICNSYQGDVTLQDGIVQENEAGFSGGGIYNFSVMTIQTSTISSNSAVNHGGGLANGGNGELNILRSTINNNTALVGSGIAHSGVGMTILNSTISGNEAENGIAIGITTDADIIHSTITHNISIHPSGKGLNVGRTGTLNIKNSIVAHNSPSDCYIEGTLSASGENLDSDGTCAGFTITADPVLGPLANNGGPTETHALLPGSPAIDAAVDCDDLSSPPVLVTTDQRGESRPGGAQCDLGAYEFIPPSPTPPPPPFLITFIVNVNCRIGPHYDHVVVFTYQADETANAIGRNEDGSWLAVADPEGEDYEVWCWVPDEHLDHDMDVFTLPVRDHLPNPDQLVPDEEAAGCWWDDPLDNNAKVCKAPCPNDAFSGGPCNP